MSDVDIKVLADRLFAAMNSKDLESADRLCDNDRLREACHRFLGAFPDVRITPGWSITEGDMIATWIEIEGTHGGSFRGIPATSKEVRSAAIYALRRRGDHFIDYWLAADWLGVLDQIGVLRIETP